MQQKYVRHSIIGFVIWPRTDRLWHSQVGALLRSNGGEIVSAGFCTFDGGEVRCFDRSDSLNIDSRPDDAAAMAKQLGLKVQA